MLAGVVKPRIEKRRNHSTIGTRAIKVIIRTTKGAKIP